MSCLIETEVGLLWRRHIDHLKELVAPLLVDSEKPASEFRPPMVSVPQPTVSIIPQPTVSVPEQQPSMETSEQVEQPQSSGSSADVDQGRSETPSRSSQVPPTAERYKFHSELDQTIIILGIK